MAYVQSHTVLIRHRKLVYLAELLQIPPVHALGHIHALWHVVLEQAEDGDVAGWTDHFLSTSACWMGDESVFVAKLRESGWLDGTLLHDWLDYAGAYLTAKYKEINVAYLRDIWRKHGRTYGKRKGSRKEVKRIGTGIEKELIPSLPILSPPIPSSPLISPQKIKNLSGASPDPRVKEFIDFFFSEFRIKTGQRYHVNGGKDGKTVQGLLKDLDLDTLKDRARKFFSDPNRFTTEAGFTIGVFASQVNKLVGAEDSGGSSLRAMADAAHRHVEAGGKLP